MIEKHDDVDVFVGVDVGKSAHHAVALARDGRVLLDRGLPNDEAQLREIIIELKRSGVVLFVVEPRSSGSSPLS